MSKLMLSPNYCSCTVIQARNLPDKGKNGGPDAFCTISMGKEKFVTAVREKTTSPDWNEQCDMPVVDDAIIKLTVYHNSKSSLSKGDFIGRAFVPLRDLQDYDRVHTNWYPLANKEGRVDKARGEIQVTLQFYSKNNTTGSVFDLATKKKHLSLKDIKHSLGDKLKSASKHHKTDRTTGENQLADQRRRLEGGHDGNGRDFLEDSISDTTSFSGSYMSLNSMSFNNNANEQPRRKSRVTTQNNGLGPALGSVTPHSSRRSITSDYETSSILDSASMYGGDDGTTSSSADRFQTPQQLHREVSVDENQPWKKTPKQRREKEQHASKPIPIIITTKASANSPQISDHNRHSSVTGDDIEAAFDSINNYKASLNKPKENTVADSYFGLSTISEHQDVDENPFSSNQQPEEEIDFDNYFTKHKQQKQDSIEEKKPKRTAPILQQSKTVNQSKEDDYSKLALSNEIFTPSTSVSIKTDTNNSSASTVPVRQQSEEKHNSTDDDIDEIIGKLEVIIFGKCTHAHIHTYIHTFIYISFFSHLNFNQNSLSHIHTHILVLASLFRVSSMRSSVRRKIQPTHDIMQPSFFEVTVVPRHSRTSKTPDNKPSSTYSQTPKNQKKNTTLPDIVIEQAGKGPAPLPPSKKSNTNTLNVLGYENVKSVSVNPKVRQELDYLDREELLHVIAYQSDLIKKRDTRVKDLEQYTDGLLVKIVEQCPSILQSGNMKINYK
ncbi:unnamed protein product [Adineta ricciae]|uniref:Rab11 family-interacting protein 1 n=1 Tax=Adineta ricciae TaxID=249248 RepID=A0A814CTW5_ADIRI|nr:unnamed protein product [Adineta ricciae]